MVHDHDTSLLHIAVGLNVLRFDKFTPGIRTYKQRLFGSPVIMGKHDVRFDIVHDQFHILITVLTDGIAKIHHIFRLQKEIHQHIFKAHEEMQSLKHTCGHESHNQFSSGTNLICFLNKWLP